MLLSDLARRENEMKGFSKTQHPLDGQNLKRFQKDTGEALAKIWRIR